MSGLLGFDRSNIATIGFLPTVLLVNSWTLSIHAPRVRVQRLVFSLICRLLSVGYAAFWCARGIRCAEGGMKGEFAACPNMGCWSRTERAGISRTSYVGRSSSSAFSAAQRSSNIRGLRIVQREFAPDSANPRTAKELRIAAPFSPRNTSVLQSRIEYSPGS